MNTQNEQPLPAIKATLDGTTVDLATEAIGAWTAVIFYRGHW